MPETLSQQVARHDRLIRRLRLRAAGAASAGVAPGDPISIDATVRALFARTTSTTEHAATILQGATSGAGVALNVASANPDDSAMYLNGPPKTRGVLKISHDGQADGSDASGSGLSIDMRTAGSAARGIYLWSTDGGLTGDALTIRVSSAVTALTREDLVVKATGRCGIGTGLGTAPAGQLEVAAADDATPGIVTRGRTTGTNQQEWRRPSDGAVRTRISTAAQFVTQEVAYFAGPAAQVGSTSTTVGNGSGVLGIANAGTVPTTSPVGGVVLYSEAGVLKVRDPAGLVTVLSEDTGWVNVTVASGKAAFGGEPPQVRRIAKVVYARGGWGNTGVAASTATQNLGTIPAGYLPATGYTVRGTPGMNLATSQARLSITPSGAVNVDTTATVPTAFLMTGIFTWTID